MKWKLIPKFRRKVKTSYTLLEAVIKAIEDEPKRINMDRWVADVGGEQDYLIDNPRMKPACGTQGCIAGWMRLMTTTKADYTFCNTGTLKYALDLLPYGIHGEAHSLFVSNFPRDPDGTLKDQKRYARDVVANIRAFMDRHEVALKGHAIR